MPRPQVQGEDPAAVARQYDYRMAVADIIRNGRYAVAGRVLVKQAELAKLAGVSRWTISQLENGHISVGFDVLLNVFWALGYQPGEAMAAVDAAMRGQHHAACPRWFATGGMRRYPQPTAPRRPK